jgi:hypothetical protein
MLENRSLSVEDASSQLSRSPRWTYHYRYLIQSLVSLRDRLPLHLELLDWFVHRGEGGGHRNDLRRYLGERGYRTSDAELSRLLAGYCKAGYLLADGDVLRWARPAHLDESAVVGRAVRAAGLVRIIASALRRHVDSGDAMVRHMHLTITADAYEEMIQEIKAATEKAHKKAISSSLRDMAEAHLKRWVVVDTIVLSDTSPYYPERRP